MKTTQSPNERPAALSGPRPLTESEIESLKEEMKQAMDYMKKRLEDSGLGEELRQRLRKRDM